MKNTRSLLIVLAIFLGIQASNGQQVFRLWPEVVGAADKDIPTLTMYTPDSDNVTGTAIVICPGGAYRGLAKHEGEDYARFLNMYGITAFVLKYRLGCDGYGFREITADAAKVIRMVRARAIQWNLNPNAIGIMGSSAGGHLASTMMTHFDNGDPASRDSIERVSSRPDFGVLCYPVISMGPIGHKVSRENFLGLNPSEDLVTRYSNELQVTASTPPCFLWHTVADQAVSVENSLEFARALQKNGVPFDLHLYEQGKHGLGLGDKPPFANTLPWTRDLVAWLKLRGLIKSLVPRAIAQSVSQSPQGWDGLPALLKRTSPPVFPNKVFDVTGFGAVGDGETDCSKAFKLAIEKCNAEGGGRVVVPKGVYLTGAIHLKSNVNLYVSKDATIRFSTDPRKYLPVVFTRWEGVECMNYSALIYAFEQENIAVTGEGVLDGQGASGNWWSWKGNRDSSAGKSNQNEGRRRLMDMGEKGIPVSDRTFGEGSFLRPNFFQPYRCKNVLVEGVTFKNSPMWFLHPVLCKNVSIIGVTTEGQGPNNDGCDPESCTDVLIKKCFFNNGDDCIAIKSGRNDDGRRVDVPSENIIIQGCTMKNGHGGVVIGSEVSGSVRNVFAEDCTMDSPNLDRALRIKTNAVRGGVIENVYMRNVRVGQVAEAVVKVDFYYEEGDKGNFTPIVRNVEIKNLECNKSRFGIWIRAYDRSPATRIYLENCTFKNVAEPDVLDNVKDLSLINVKVMYRSGVDKTP